MKHQSRFIIYTWFDNKKMLYNSLKTNKMVKYEINYFPDSIEIEKLNISMTKIISELDYFILNNKYDRIPRKLKKKLKKNYLLWCGVDFSKGESQAVECTCRKNEFDLIEIKKP